MRTSQRFNQTEQGFTRLGLIAAAGILGIVGAIALPSYFAPACACLGPEANARSVTRSLAIAQQAFFVENGAFSDSAAALSDWVPDSTEHYYYIVAPREQAAVAYATSRNTEFKGAASGLFLSPSESGTEPVATFIICQAQNPGIEPVAAPVDSETCGRGTELVERHELRPIGGE